LKAAAAAKDYGLEVIGAVGVIDRLEGGRVNFDAAGIPLVTLLTIDDFIPANQR
jgi:orotate phosphoribosyltransferase